MDHRLPESQAHWHAPEYAAPTNHHGSTRASGETTGQQPGEGSYRRVFQLPAQPTNKSNHTSNRGGWTSPSHLPPLPILPPSRSASTSASDSPTASGLPLSATLSPYYQSQPATYDWATQALPSMRLKPPTPPLTHPSGRRPHLQPLAPFGGSREGQPRRAYSEDGEQARFHSSVLALTSLASHGVEPEEDQATSSGGSNESGRGGVDLPHKTYASTDSEDGGDGVASDGKKKRKRRRKANEEPRDAAMRRFVCQADGCDKSFARPSALATHGRSHSKEKPHVCPFPTCHRPFAVSSNLRRHQKVYNHFVEEADSSTPRDLSPKIEGDDSAPRSQAPTGSKYATFALPPTTTSTPSSNSISTAPSDLHDLLLPSHSQAPYLPGPRAPL